MPAPGGGTTFGAAAEVGKLLDASSGKALPGPFLRVVLVMSVGKLQTPRCCWDSLLHGFYESRLGSQNHRTRN